EVREEEVDALELLLDLVGELALAPVVDLEQRAAARLDEAADLGVDLRDDVVRAVGAQDVDGLVLAFPAGHVSGRAESSLCHWDLLLDVRPLFPGTRRGRGYLLFGVFLLNRFMAAVKPLPTICSTASAASVTRSGSSFCSARVKSEST